MNFKRLFLIPAIILGITACDLDEELIEDLTAEEAKEIFATAKTAEIQSLIQGVYSGFVVPFQDQSRFWAAQEHTGDLAIGPTRGGDWDDGGVWRVLHNHTWSADHAFLSDTFTEILQIVFSSTNALQFKASMSAAQIAEVRFLRAFAIFAIADGWGQVPFRDADSNLIEPSGVLTVEEALSFVISELIEIISDLPAEPANRANADAGIVLLMKVYLNRGAFFNRSSPEFSEDDMKQVIKLADTITGYSLEDNYYDNFAPDNDAVSSENIWTMENVPGVNRGGNTVRSRWFCTLHYNQDPSGWNGFTTLSDFYDSFEDDDVRRYAETSIFAETGFNNGFLVGQQFGFVEDTTENKTDSTKNKIDSAKNKIKIALQDRKGNPLSFTPEVALLESGNNLEVTGIRVMKYIPDIANGDNIDNDAVVFRYADVLLMKAEAQLRNGDAASALTIVNEIRAARKASTLSSLTLDELLAERGRELYWEGWRRQDLIRFGKFLDAWQNKPASGTERLLFAIPADQVALNPNLKQNPGY